MSIIEVKKNEKGRFRVIINGIQEGCDLSKAELANTNAIKLKDKYPNALVFPFPVSH